MLAVNVLISYGNMRIYVYMDIPPKIAPAPK